MNREELLNALKTAYETLAPIEGQMNDVVDQSDEWLELHNQYVELLDNRDIFVRIILAMIRLYFWCCIMLLAGFCVKSMMGGNVASPMIIGLIFAVYLANRKFIKRKIIKKRMDAAFIDVNAEYEAYKKRKADLIAANPDIFGFLPIKYTKAEIISKFIEYIENQRADSLKEAINLYEQEKRH